MTFTSKSTRVLLMAAASSLALSAVASAETIRFYASFEDLTCITVAS